MPAAPTLPSPAQQYTQAKAGVYGALAGLRLADAMGVLSDILAESSAQGITSREHVEEKIHYLQELAAVTVPEDFIHLVAGSLNAYIHTKFQTAIGLKQES